jgi:serine/threonine protein kinase
MVCFIYKPREGGDMTDSRIKIDYLDSQIDPADLDEKGVLINDSTTRQTSLETEIKEEKDVLQGLEKESKKLERELKELEKRQKQKIKTELKELEKKIEETTECIEDTKKIIKMLTQGMIKTTVNDQAEDIILYKPIASGGFGKVWLAQQKKDNKWIAVKILDDFDEKRIQKETKQLEQQEQFIFLQDNCIGMKLLEGFNLDELRNIEKKADRSVFSLVQLLVISKDVLKKIAYVHNDANFIRKRNANDESKENKTQQFTIHRDIKPSNILLNPETLTVEYCDYGLAAQINQPTNVEGKQELSVSSNSFMGTYPFAAPEQLEASILGRPVVYNEQTEIFAIGMTLARLFDLAEPGKKYYGYPRYEIESNPAVPQNITDYIRRMVNPDPKKRPTVIEAQHFFNNELHERSKKRKPNIVVVSIEKFVSFSEEEKRELIEAIIQSPVDAVVLQGSSEQEYYKVRQELIKNHIISIAPFMVQGEQDVVYQVVKNHYNSSLCSVDTTACNMDDIIKGKKLKDVLKNMQDIYPDIGGLRLSHQKDIKKLIDSVKTDIKHDDIMKKIEKCFMKVFHATSLLGGRLYPAPKDLINKLNAEPTKHHFLRMLALILKKGKSKEFDCSALDDLNADNQRLYSSFMKHLGALYPDLGIAESKTSRPY